MMLARRKDEQMAKKINIDVNLRDEEAKKKLKNLQEGKYKVDMDVNADGINQTTKGMNRLSTSAQYLAN